VQTWSTYPVPVASDADGKIADSYHLKIDPEEQGFKDTRGVEVGHGFAERTTFVVSSDGIIAATIGGLAPATNVDRALAAVRRLAGAGQPAKK
jgi:thioredoxin-dependent peroxiredoxin